MVLLREDGMTQPKIAELTGISLSTVNRAHMAYDNGGVNALRPKPTGGRPRENMTSLAEEKALLARLAKAAGAGQLLNVRELKLAYDMLACWLVISGVSWCRDISSGTGRHILLSAR